MDLSSPGNLVFRLTPDAARQLEEKLGMRIDRALIGRTVRVKGTLERVPLARTSKGTARGSGRVRYEVKIESLDDVTVR
ncbi:hypothetical protein [Sphingomonas sp.]|uniref:hypothetical protein n=1 Tax=Sphingomonas sp. TaxID=28214 RepID=UPI00289BA7C3|nr:hypothetical protein [Sphingomonas sp.]